MMQPPRQIVAIAPGSMSQSYSSLPAWIWWKPCAYATILEAYSACSTSADEVLADVAGRARPGPGRPRAAARRSACPDSDAGEHRLGDAADRHAQVERGLHGPAAGALLLGLVEHHVDERLPGRGVDVRRAPRR